MFHSMMGIGRVFSISGIGHVYSMNGIGRVSFHEWDWPCFIPWMGLAVFYSMMGIGCFIPWMRLAVLFHDGDWLFHSMNGIGRVSFHEWDWPCFIPWMGLAVFYSISGIGHVSFHDGDWPCLFHEWDWPCFIPWMGLAVFHSMNGIGRVLFHDGDWLFHSMNEIGRFIPWWGLAVSFHEWDWPCFIPWWGLAVSFHEWDWPCFIPWMGLAVFHSMMGIGCVSFHEWNRLCFLQNGSNWLTNIQTLLGSQCKNSYESQFHGMLGTILMLYRDAFWALDTSHVVNCSNGEYGQNWVAIVEIPQQKSREVMDFVIFFLNFHSFTQY